MENQSFTTAKLLNILGVQMIFTKWKNKFVKKNNIFRSFNIRNFEIWNYRSFYIWLFQILTPTPNQVDEQQEKYKDTCTRDKESMRWSDKELCSRTKLHTMHRLIGRRVISWSIAPDTHASPPWKMGTKIVRTSSSSSSSLSSSLPSSSSRFLLLLACWPCHIRFSTYILLLLRLVIE